MCKPITSRNHIPLQVRLNDKERGFGNQKIDITDDALNHLILTSGGDARVSLGNLELAVLSTPIKMIGGYEVEVKLYKGVSAKLKLNVQAK